MTDETKAAMWQRRAVLRHAQSSALTQKVADLQALCKALHIEYDKAVIDGATFCRALSNMSDLASQAGLVHRYCRLCGVAWAMDPVAVPPGARSGASVCDQCMEKHDHWKMDEVSP